VTATAEEEDEALKGSEELWLDTAYQLLLESGVDAVRIMTLAKRLKLSRTSFYWYFEDREALLQALIDRWKNKNTGNLVAQTRKYAGTITEAIFNLFDCWLNPELFDRKLDVAIRAWAGQAPELKQTLDQMDQERIEAIAAMFQRFGYSEGNADVRASTVYYTQVGYISLRVEEPIVRRVLRMPDYIEIFTGSYPSDAEINRFLSRHEALLKPSLPQELATA
jgi:AcrR family transcriptional regulator